MIDNETEEKKKAARAAILAELVNAPSDEASVDIIIKYFRQGHDEGMKKGVKQTMLAIKQQIDDIVAKLTESSGG